MKKPKFSSYVIILAVFGFVLLLQIAGAFNWLDNKTYDSRMKATASTIHASDEIAVVFIDRESLDWASSELGWGWPWPRKAYGDMVDFFSQGEAASVAFDFTYTETSVYGQEDDNSFAKSCAEYGKVVQTVFYSAKDDYSTPLLPVSVLTQSAGVIANTNSFLDSDGCSRRQLLSAPSELQEPTLAIGSLKISGKKTDFDDVPAAKNGGMYVRYIKDINDFIPYSAMEILQSKYAIEKGEEPILEPENFEDMMVFVGANAPGLFDICTTPVSSSYQGMGVHLNQANTILEEAYLYDTPLLLQMLLILVITIFAHFFANSLSKSSSRLFTIKICLLLFFVILYIFICYIAFIFKLIMPVAAPVAAYLICFLVTFIKTYFKEGKMKKFLKLAFKQYLSPAVIESLINNPDSLKLGGEKREITAFFSDIQNFTTISETLEPEQLTEVLNTYLTAMSDIILELGGTIDKYEGDAIIAFWNAPLYQEDHGKLALEAAIKCQQKLEEMQSELFEKTGKSIKQRIGLNSGNAVVGNLGSKNRFDYTMIGDSVNLASRLEGMNKFFGTYTMCSEETMNLAVSHGCQLKFRLLGNVAVVGKKSAVKVYQPMTAEQFEANKEIFQKYENGLGEFVKGDFKKARNYFEEISEDAAAQSLIRYIDDYKKKAPEDWNGIIKATEK